MAENEKSSEILTPNRKLRNMHSVTVLFVGSETINKNILANAVLERASHRHDKVSFNINCRTAWKLPLPADPDNQRPNIDYVVMLTDNKEDSFTNLKKSLKFLDVEYFLGKICIILASNGEKDSENSSINEESLAALADTYRLTPLFVDLQNVEDTRAVADMLLYKMEIGVGLKNGVSPLLLMANQAPFLTRLEDF